MHQGIQTTKHCQAAGHAVNKVGITDSHAGYLWTHKGHQMTNNLGETEAMAGSLVRDILHAILGTAVDMRPPTTTTPK